MTAPMILARLYRDVFLPIILILAMMAICAHPATCALAAYVMPVQGLLATIAMFVLTILALRQQDVFLPIIPTHATTARLALHPIFAAEESVRVRLTALPRPALNAIYRQGFATHHQIALMPFSRTTLLATTEKNALRRIYAKTVCAKEGESLAEALFPAQDIPTTPSQLILSNQILAPFALCSIC